jgi:enterochelin esterase-like enzyme
MMMFAAFVNAEETMNTTPSAFTVVQEQRGLPVNRVAYVVKSPFIKDVAVKVIVRTPSKMEPGKRYPVLYFLNEYAGNCTAWKDQLGLENLVDTCQTIFVDAGYPTHSWYVDHPTDPRMRDESFFLKAVIPLVDSKYPTIPEGKGRFLIGYSKGGFGAFTLLLRHPDLFARAAAWDAPLSLDKPDRWNMPEAYGTQENYDQYSPLKLFQAKADLFRNGPSRFVLLGYGLFKDETEKAHQKMTELGIPHDYENATKRDHNWESGWLADAVKRLLGGPVKSAP